MNQKSQNIQKKKANANFENLSVEPKCENLIVLLWVQNHAPNLQLKTEYGSDDKKEEVEQTSVSEGVWAIKQVEPQEVWKNYLSDEAKWDLESTLSCVNWEYKLK